MTTLILIRHGESEANRQGIFAGQINPDLQDRGLKQAELTAKYIAENYKVDKIYSSDLIRAYKTAQSLGNILDMEIIKEPKLREIHGGKWEGMKFSELSGIYPKVYETWMNDIGNSACPEGENLRSMCVRIMDVLTEIARENDGKTVAIATHATPIRIIQTMIQKGTLNEMSAVPWVSNASVTVVEYSDNKWDIKLVSEDKHLAELITKLPDNV